MASKRPYVFIGSSTEGLGIAQAIQANVDYSCECQIWSQRQMLKGKTGKD